MAVLKTFRNGKQIGEIDLARVVEKSRSGSPDAQYQHERGFTAYQFELEIAGTPVTIWTRTPEEGYDIFESERGSRKAKM
jgi:hypothetical protein